MDGLRAELVLPGDPLEETIRFFTEEVGFRLERIHPADDPRVAVLEGYGVRLRLERDGGGDPGVLRIGPADAARELRAPNGTRVCWRAVAAAGAPPPLEAAFVLSRAAEATWSVGRAGMQYRDLVPGRQGGRFVASHIRIPAGGPVPDYVHHHAVRFQTIVCMAGWVRVVYEDQGEPFVLEPGDAVLQPPHIRHRVLEASPGLEVLELASPAEHETSADHALVLPTEHVRPERAFGGQRFVRHVASAAPWRDLAGGRGAVRESAVAAATDGLAGVRALRLAPGTGGVQERHAGELVFRWLAGGSARLLRANGDAHALGPGDAWVVPAGELHALEPGSDGTELIEISLPADPGWRAAAAVSG